MGHSCTFRKIIKVEDENGKIITKLAKCMIHFNLKVIEFKHPDYPELSEFQYLCESHFIDVFGEIKDEEDQAFRNYMNSLYSYKKDFAYAQKYAEYFNARDFKFYNYIKVEKKKKRFDEIKRGICRYEGCEERFENVRKVYRIIISRLGGIDFKGYYFCGKPHWEKIKQRIIPKIEEGKPIVKSLKEYM